MPTTAYRLVACLFPLLCLCVSVSGAPIRGSVRSHDDAALFEKRRLKMEKKQKDQATPAPTPSPNDQTAAPTPDSSIPGSVTYVPGLLTVEENGLLLSQGLRSRIIAETNDRVAYANGDESTREFHPRPDYGAVFPVPDDFTENQGGWIYLSNSEVGEPAGQGGVGGITFDSQGNVLKYEMVLENTTRNCAGGRTAWGTFVSCEEVAETGQVWQVDPFGRRPPEKLTMGLLGGRYEAFAYDDRNQDQPRYFVTEDQEAGPTLRWTPDPDNIDWVNPWDMVHGDGTLEYLVLNPEGKDGDTGTYEWVDDIQVARENSRQNYRGSEGMDRKDNFLFIACKTDKFLFILDLDTNRYFRQSTDVGLFDGEPDIVKRIVNASDHDVLYFTEDYEYTGVHGRNSQGQFFTIFEAPGWDRETTGLAFSPSGHHMYVAIQDPGVLFEITREDGYPFQGVSLEVDYHNDPIDDPFAL